MSEKKNLSVFFIYFIVLVCLTLVRIFLGYYDLAISENMLTYLYTFITQVLIMGLIPIALYIARDKGNFSEKINRVKKDFYIKAKLPVFVYVLLILSGILTYHIIIGVSVIANGFLGSFGYKFYLPSPTIYDSGFKLALGIIFTALLPGIFEEITHRGLLLSGLRKYGDNVAVVISALFFGLMHQNIVQFVYAFVIGIFFALLTIKSGSIIPAMILHFINNSLSVILDYSKQIDAWPNTVFNAIYGNVEGIVYPLIMLSWAVAAVLLYNIINFIGIITKHHKSIKLLDNKQEQLVLLKQPLLVACLFLGAVTTIYTLIWGFIR